MGKKCSLLVLIGGFIGILGWAYFVQAGGFGVSPPDVSNYHLTPGSHFEKTIYLIRGEPETDAQAQVSIEAPEIESWIKIGEGMNFTLPKGEQKVPMTVIIDVPSDADFGPYQGNIQVRAVSIGEKKEGQVSMVLGARIGIDLVVAPEEFSDFRLLGVNVNTFEQGAPLKVSLRLENFGNVKIRPSKVHIDIYDIAYKNILASGDIIEMSWVGPFETDISRGEWQNNLGLGEYWAEVTVYKEKELIGTSKIHFQVVPKGSLKEEVLPVEEGKGFPYFYLGIGIGAVSLIVLIILLLLIRREGRIKPKRVSKKRIKRE